MDPQNKRPIGRQIRDTNAFSGTSLLFGVLSSAVSAAIIPALGAGRVPTVAGAALSPLVVAVFTTRGAVFARTIGIAALSAVALLITISGYTIPEAIAGGGSLTAAGSGTFVTTERTPTPTRPSPSPPAAKPPTGQATKPPTRKPPTTKPPKSSTPPAEQTGKVDVPEIRECPRVVVGEAEACKQIGIRNSGSATVEVSTSELAGDQAGDFTLTKRCNGTLRPGTSCSIRLRFSPSATGVRTASVVVHVQPGGTAHRVTITGTATEGADERPETTPSESPRPTDPPLTIEPN